jgi:hypothetical protein
MRDQGEATSNERIRKEGDGSVDNASETFKGTNLWFLKNLYLNIAIVDERVEEGIDGEEKIKDEESKTKKRRAGGILPLIDRSQIWFEEEDEEEDYHEERNEESDDETVLLDRH